MRTRLVAEMDQLNETMFFFASQDRLNGDSRSALDRFAGQLSDLLESCQSLGVDMTITLVGQVDGTGTAEQNERTSLKRVKVIKDKLVSAGIDADLLLSKPPELGHGGEDLAQRRVTVLLTSEDQP